MTSTEVHRVGDIDDPASRVVRIVHISDTHLMHDSFVEENLIPDGDILVHSGDFDKCHVSRLISRDSDYLSEIAAINAFFSGLPHPTKIFVAGNHETNFPRQQRQRTASLLAPSCIYLQDASVNVNGVNFYGSPWNGLRHKSFARAFTISYSSLPAYWQQIPADTDVLVTHSPAYGVADLGSNKHLLNVSRHCQDCQDYHKVYRHFGCRSLLDEILHRVRPAAHLFGHAHEPSGVQVVEGVLFSNAAMACNKSAANVIDFYVGSERQQRECSTQPQYTTQHDSRCLVM